MKIQPCFCWEGADLESRPALWQLSYSHWCDVILELHKQLYLAETFPFHILLTVVHAWLSCFFYTMSQRSIQYNSILVVVMILILIYVNMLSQVGWQLCKSYKLLLFTLIYKHTHTDLDMTTTSRYVTWHFWRRQINLSKHVLSRHFLPRTTSSCLILYISNLTNKHYSSKSCSPTTTKKKNMWIRVIRACEPVIKSQQWSLKPAMYSMFLNWSTLHN